MIKICKNCKYIREFKWRWFPSINSDIPRCSHPEARPQHLVYGGEPYAIDERQGGNCGKSGVLWEAK
jgi:hypothetical protein